MAPAARRGGRDRVCCLLICAAVLSPVARAAGNVDLFDMSIEELGNIRVTGTRIRGASVPAPMIVVTRKQFTEAGFLSVEALFESLPQNFDEVTPDGRFANEGGSLLRGLNNSRVTAIDLRGLGAQSTLTLVDGHRRAGSIDGRVVDVSVIPLSILERVEVVTGGRSAIYGADAVAGVVNLVTRGDFEGMESQLSYGLGEGGGEKLQFGQIVGLKGNRGNFVAAYDFTRHWPLDLSDIGLLSLAPNPAIGLTQLTLNAQADSRRHALYASGRLAVTEDIEVYADGLYTDSKFDDLALRRFEGATENSFTDVVNPSEHLALSAGARKNLGADWTLDVGGGFSTADNTSRSSLFIDLGFTSITSELKQKAGSELPTVSVVLDGPLPSVGRIEPRAVFGTEWRKETFESATNNVSEADLARNVRSAFAEVSLPLVDDGRPGIGYLELSLAARYDDYSDFGGTFNPQIGALWTPVNGVTFRGTYSTAFRAPALVELESTTDAFLERVADPAQGGAAVPVLFAQGEDPNLQAEEAKTWSIGSDYEPSFARWARLSLSYFHIDYDGRIEQPSINADRGLVLERSTRFPGLITREPTPEQAAALLAEDQDGFIPNDTGVPFDPASQEILDVFPDLVLFDNRTSNIATEAVRGLDLGIDGSFETGHGSFGFGVNVAQLFEHDRRVTATSPAFSLLNEIGKPVDTRIRATGRWDRDAYGISLYINHVGGYTNPFSTPPSRIGSWTTADLSLRFDGSDYAGDGFLHGLGLTLSVRNLLDNDPPFFPNSLLGVQYDSTNASPFGRYVSLRLSKHW